MKKLIATFIFTLLAFNFIIVCHAQNITISLSAGESYEFTNTGRIESTIQTSNPYLSNSVYDYAIYNQDGSVHETGMLKSQLGIYKVPAGGRMVITVISSSKPMEFWGSDQSLTGKPADEPALHRITLKPGENYEFSNNGTAEDSLEVVGDDNNLISYDYAVYNKDGTVYHSSISVSYNTSIKVPAGGRVVITAALTSKPVSFGGAGQFFSGSFSVNLALYRVTMKAGESCEFLNSGLQKNTIETYTANPSLAEYSFKVYDQDGKLYYDSNVPINYETSIKVPPGGRLAAAVSSSSSPVEFGGCFEFFNPAGTMVDSNELKQIFQYENIEKADSTTDVLSAVSEAYSKLSGQLKQNDDVKEKSLQFGEYAIEKIATREIAGQDEILQINYDTIKEQLKEAETAAGKVEELLKQNKIDTNRELELSIKLKAVGVEKDFAAAVQKDLVKGLGILHNIRVDNGEVIVTLPVKNIEKEIGTSSGLTIEVNKETRAVKSIISHRGASGISMKNMAYSDISSVESPVYRIGLKQGEKTVSKLNSNIKLAFPIAEEDPEYNCVFIVEGEGSQIAEPVGGKYVQVTGKIEIESKSAGRYYVKENRKTFKDIGSKDAMMKKAIEVMASKGIISGKDENNFDPDGVVSRAELVKLIVRTLYSMDKDAKADFKDVPDKAWYYPYVASSKKEGLVNGYPDNTFRGKNTITKEEIIKVCAASLQGKKRYKHPENEGKYIVFKDNTSVPDWVRKYLALAVREGLIIRRADGNFQGSKPMTRGETALILYRLFEKM